MTATADVDRFLIFDIGTVPDEGILEHFSPKAPTTNVPPIASRIICISFLGGCVAKRIIAERGGSLGTPDTAEADLLREFWRCMKGRAPTLVTWNGRRFAIPVLLHRSLLHGVSAAPWYAGARYDGFDYRYVDHHIDLMDLMLDYGAIRSYGLDAVAASLGLPGKTIGEGSDVQAMFAQGEIDKIRANCECDCLNIFGLYLRWSMLTGRLNEADLKDCRRLLESFLERERSIRPHYGAFLDVWRNPKPAMSLANCEIHTSETAL